MHLSAITLRWLISCVMCVMCMNRVVISLYYYLIQEESNGIYEKIISNFFQKHIFSVIHRNMVILAEIYNMKKGEKSFYLLKNVEYKNILNIILNNAYSSSK